MKITQGFDRAIFDKELDLDLNTFILEDEYLTQIELDCVHGILKDVELNVHEDGRLLYIQLDDVVHTFASSDREPFHISEIAEFITYNHKDFDYHVEDVIRNSRWLVLDRKSNKKYGNLKIK